MISELERGKRIRERVNKFDTSFLTDLELKEILDALAFVEGFFEKEQIVLSGIRTYRNTFEIMARFRQLDYEKSIS